jgi:hypothetical protein
MKVRLGLGLCRPSNNSNLADTRKEIHNSIHFAQVLKKSIRPLHLEGSRALSTHKIAIMLVYSATKEALPRIAFGLRPVQPTLERKLGNNEENHLSPCLDNEILVVTRFRGRNYCIVAHSSYSEISSS